MLAQSVVDVLADSGLDTIAAFHDLLLQGLVISDIADDRQCRAAATQGKMSFEVAQLAWQQILAGKRLRHSGAEGLLQVMHDELPDVSGQKIHDAMADDCLWSEGKLVILGGVEAEDQSVLA